ncbi:MAG TPA: GNAT family N-acetyltransferase, partial [Mycobacteriales bacterium]|nr:GNAT family N-acetyltransferase [Mycobacteriales bacterium]
GWATDIAVLEHAGSTIEDRGDHLIVRTPHNPTFHWGNCVLVTDPDAVEDAQRWVQTFQAAFPAATWTAIGLTAMPRNAAPWLAHDLTLEVDEVLVASSVPRQTALPPGYAVRRMAGDDWEQAVALAMAENERTGAYAPASHEPFARASMETERALSDRDVAAFFGAFADGVLAAYLGVVRCGTTARYQSVGTDAPHRRRGLAAHLLGVAARWAAEHGCDHWVIVTEATNPAGRVYRSVGFQPDTASVQAYRH